jgi:hypothetical protein
MAWRSLFAFSNPTGRIGSQYNATINTILSGTPVTGAQNLAYFTSLPIGVYSIVVQYRVDISTVNATPTQYIFEIGASASSASSINYPVVSLGAPNTIINTSLGVANVYINANFIINVTNSNTIYINNYTANNAISNTIYRYDSPFVTYTSCIATKLA